MTWGSIFHPKDTSGRESRTLFFVGVTVLLLWAALGLVLWKFWVAPMEVMSFASAVVTLCGGLATIIGIWLGREWIKK